MSLIAHGEQERSRQGFTLTDALIISVLALLAWAAFSGKWCGLVPFLNVSSDAGDMFSYAASLDHPTLFANDAALGNPQYLNFYQLIHINILRAITRLTGDYGLSYIALFAPLLFLQNLGFYLLGRALFRSRFWAFLLVLPNLGFYYITGLWTYWGIFSEPQTRFFLQTLSPLFLLAAYLCRERPKLWPLLMLGAGLLTNLHPPGGPVWAFAVWLGLWPFALHFWSWRKAFVYMTALGLLYLASTLPFLVPWTFKSGGASPAAPDYQTVYQIARARFGVEYFDTLAAVRAFFRPWGRHGLWLFWVGAVAGWFAVLRLNSGQIRRVLMVNLWVAGVIATAVGFSWAHKSLAHWLRVLPIEVDIVRSIRFLIPLMVVFCLWPLALICRRVKSTGWPGLARRGAVIATGAALCLVLLMRFPAHGNIITKGLGCLARGQLTCSCGQAAHRAKLDMLRAVKRLVPPGGRMFASNTDLQVLCRYYCLRPLVWGKKDVGGVYYNANASGLAAWNRTRGELVRALALKNTAAKQEAILALARKNKAQYLLVDWAWKSAPGQSQSPAATLLWYGNGYSLLRI